jgi:crotonobetaine/carnitine-CoA ligase
MPHDAQEGFVERFTAQAKSYPQRLFATYQAEPVSFGWLHQASDAFAAALRRRGVERNDRVAVMLRNGRATLAILYGLAKAGIVWVPVNVQQRGEGLRYILDHADPKLAIVEDDLLPVLAASGTRLDPGAMVAAQNAGGVPAWLGGAHAFDEPAPTPDSTFAIMYTSGTTGPPKGVIVSHQMLRLAGEGVTRVAGARDGDVFFVWEPLYHIGGAQLLVIPLLADVVLTMVERFSGTGFWEQVKACGATHIHYLGGILQILLKQPQSPLDRAHGVRIAWGGGAPSEIWGPFQERFGIKIRECYGMTEASSITTCNDLGIVGSVGRPMPWLSVQIIGADGQPLAGGQRGEIVTREIAPGAITKGYFRNPEATAKALRDGQLHTGDLGSFDEAGNLYFHGRMSDSVRCKGENVSAWEVEHVAASHPAVEDCAMIGVRTDVGEQDIKLFLKPRAGASIDLPAFSAWIGSRLAPYQNPRYLVLVEEFERTPSLRIMKHKLSRALDDGWDRLSAVTPLGCVAVPAKEDASP